MYMFANIRKKGSLFLFSKIKYLIMRNITFFLTVSLRSKASSIDCKSSNSITFNSVSALVRNL